MNYFVKINVNIKQWFDWIVLENRFLLFFIVSMVIKIMKISVCQRIEDVV